MAETIEHDHIKVTKLLADLDLIFSIKQTADKSDRYWSLDFTLESGDQVNLRIGRLPGWIAVLHLVQIDGALNEATLRRLFELGGLDPAGALVLKDNRLVAVSNTMAAHLDQEALKSSIRAVLRLAAEVRQVLREAGVPFSEAA